MGWSRLAVIAVLGCLAPALAGCGNSSSHATTAGSSRAATAGSSHAAATIARENMTVHLGGYVSHAQLSYPAGGGRHPVVVLIPGSGPEDGNADICQPRTGKVLSHNFADIATHLSARGYAVMRYDKRGVTGPCRGSFRYTLPELLADAGRVLSAAERSRHVDAHRVFVYGWSEGSTVAAALVLAHPKVAGLIVQGGVVPPWPSVFDYQVLQVGVPYLRSFAPDGRVDSAVLARAEAGNGGLVAKDIVQDVAAPPSRTASRPAGRSAGGLAIRPQLDTNHDGVLSIDREFIPVVPRIVAFLLSPAGPLHTYAPGSALPVLGQQAGKLTLPMLILQGGHDSNVPAAGASVFERALRSKDKTLKLYPGLGHSLGPASSVLTDDFAPIAGAPLADLTTWLDAHH